MNEWISVEDRYPDDGYEAYLFYSKELKEYSIGGSVKGVIQSYVEGLYHNNISHWMLLPEPPE